MNFKATTRPNPFAMFRKSSKPKPVSKAKADDPVDEEEPADVLDDEDDLEDKPGDDEETKKSKKARRAKKAKADGEEDEKDEDDPKASAARQRERDRVAAILSNPIVVSGGAPIRAAALHLATCSDMSRSKAIKTLGVLVDATQSPGSAPGGGAPSSPRGTLQELYPDSLHARNYPNTPKGRSDYWKASADMAARITAAGEMMRGERAVPFRAPEQTHHRMTPEAIVAAAAKARGEQPGEHFAGPAQRTDTITAAHIIAAGKKARGED